MKPPEPFDYDGPAPETPPAANRITNTQDKRFQAMLKAKSLTLEDVFWLVCGDKCPTCDVTRPVKDHLTRLSKLTAFVRDIERNEDHTNRSGDQVTAAGCAGAPHCRPCAATKALS